MKKTKFWALILSIVAIVTMTVGLSACDSSNDKDAGTSAEYTLSLNGEGPFTVAVGATVDYTKYFSVKDKNGNALVVTEAMLDLTNADTSTPGAFSVTLKVGGKTVTAQFIVTYDVPSGGGEGGGTSSEDDPLAAALEQYKDPASWNFAVKRTEKYVGETEDDSYEFEDYYEYNGKNILNRYESYVDEDYEETVEYTDYLIYDSTTDTYSLYSDNGDGTYEVYPEGDEYYEYFASELSLVDLTELKNVKFTLNGNKYVADDPATAGNAVLGEYSYETIDYDTWDYVTVTLKWTKFELYLTGGRISKICAALEDDTTIDYVFSKYNMIDFTAPEGTTPNPDEGGSGDEGGGSGDEGGGSGDEGGGTTPDQGSTEALAALQAALGQYTDGSKWSFAVTVTDTYEGETEEDYYEYYNNNILNRYTYSGTEYTDYLAYDPASDVYTLYADYGDGEYDIVTDDTDDYESYIYGDGLFLYVLTLSELGNVQFTYDGTKYVAKDPAAAGSAVIADFIDEDGNSYAWTSFSLTLASGRITKISAVLEGVETYEFAFSKYGSISFTLPDGSDSGSDSGSTGGGSSTGGDSGNGGGSSTTPAGVMEKQTYSASSFDDATLQDKLVAANDRAIGLPSVGTYKALVIPVQFQGETITSTQLANLKIAFNGTEEQTGWESVYTYYQKASYGKLNLTFDVLAPYTTSNNASYYQSSRSRASHYEGGSYTRCGDEAVLVEALNYYQSKLDLSQYDYNNDGFIDGVYLIYSHDVNYANGGFFWAYTTWFYGTEKFDNVIPYYYFFAGVDFMTENTANSKNSKDEIISGLKVNAFTYIHESGHMLGLDDYYDSTDNDRSCGEGVGGADMMDYTVGDQDVYSKTMLGWLTPTIVNETKTVTLTPSVSTQSAILIPLDFDNSYFGEYLMIDLYSATGLNEMHANMKDTYLYDGEKYGVRIYHISSSINDPFSDENYRAITDYNNSTTSIALIKLIEADGTKKFSDSDGWAMADDLWKAGQKLSSVFPNYTRNDGKKLNFDIEIVTATATSAQVKITFNS